MIDYRNIITDREMRLRIIKWLRFIPTPAYLKLVYRIKTGKRLNLKHPVGFNEKLNYLKIHDIHPEYTALADKYSVREHIKEKIGEEYLFPLLGVWDSFDEIDFDALPDQFVLKCTHDSGSVTIVRDKSTIDKKKLSRFYAGRQKINTYYLAREYPYKDVKPRIVAEKFMSDTDGNAPRDYKFFCFDGEPEIMFIATDRETDVTHTLFDMDFNRLPIEYVHKQTERHLEKPKMFDEMKDLSRKLSAGMKFVRIDLYEIDGKIYFGEYTFFPAGGFYLMTPPEWEKKYGDMIKLDK